MLPVLDRIARRLQRDGDCLVWPGATNGKGYGIVGTAGNKPAYVHRAVWLGLGNVIGAGLELDHRAKKATMWR